MARNMDSGHMAADDVNITAQHSRKKVDSYDESDIKELFKKAQPSNWQQFLEYVKQQGDNTRRITPGEAVAVKNAVEQVIKHNEPFSSDPVSAYQVLSKYGTEGAMRMEREGDGREGGGREGGRGGGREGGRAGGGREGGQRDRSERRSASEREGGGRGGGRDGGGREGGAKRDGGDGRDGSAKREGSHREGGREGGQRDSGQH